MSIKTRGGLVKRDTRKTERYPPRGDSDIFSSSNSRHKFLHYADGSRMPPRAIVPLAGKQTLKRRGGCALPMMQLRFSGAFILIVIGTIRLLRWERLNSLPKSSSRLARSRSENRALLSRFSRAGFEFLPFFFVSSSDS